jgi:carbon-monoxide dehydrogenase large subunit
MNLMNTLLRQEDHRLITGSGQFSSDFHAENLLHASVIRSVHSHAKLISCSYDDVLKAPGVVAVLTADDVAAAGFDALPNVVNVKNVQGEPQKVVPMPILAKDKVFFVGQPIAMVIATSAALAQDAAELAQIDYQPLESISSFEQSAKSNQLQLHEGVAENLSVRFESGDRESTLKAFEGAKYVSDLIIKSQRLIGSPMEPRAVVASYQEQEDCTHVYTPSQGAGGILKFLNLVTKWPVDNFKIHTKDVGGSFGLRGNVYSEHALVILASKKFKKPVKWVGSRSEIFLSDWHGRAIDLKGFIALDDQGYIQAIRFEDQVDLGAFNCYFSTHIGTRNLSITMGGPYQVPHLYMQSDLRYTNTVPVSAYRGAGRPDIAYAIERLLDHAAHQHGFDIVEIRKKNFVPVNAFPYKTAMGTIYDCGEFENVMDRALTLFDRSTVEEKKKSALARGHLYGWGLAYYLEASAPSSAAMDQIKGALGADGKLHVLGLTGASGQGHETSFASIIETELGLPSDCVDYKAGVDDNNLVGNSTGGSRTLYGAGSAVKSMCQKLKDIIIQKLAEQWACEPSQVGFEKNSFVHVSSNQRAELANLFKTWASQALTIEATGETISGSTFPNGCHIAEVEINIQTGESEVVRYIAIDDVGNVISPLLVEGQVHGGVIQGWGQAFGERAIYDHETGQLLTGSYMDYAMPRAGSIKHLHSENYCVPTKLNLLGAKGVGESGCSGSLPALSNAVIDALRQKGIQQMDMPFTSDRIWNALNPSFIHH